MKPVKQMSAEEMAAWVCQALQDAGVVVTLTVLKKLGFKEKGRHFLHPGIEFFVEFPTGPLMVGNERIEEVRPMT